MDHERAQVAFANEDSSGSLMNSSQTNQDEEQI